MKKTMKRFAAITATMMTISALGSISAFADPITSEHYENGPNVQNASVELQARVSNTTSSTSAGAYSNNVDTEKRIWSVTIDTANLQWDIVRNNDTKYQQKLTWDPSTHSYVKANDVSSDVVDSYSLADPLSAEKTFTIHNDSNFAINSLTTIVDNSNYSEMNSFGATFSVSNGENSIAIGSSAQPSITIDVSGMRSFDSAEYVTIGRANIALEASGAIQEYTDGGNQQEEPQG